MHTNFDSKVLEFNWFDHIFFILVGLILPAMSLISGSMDDDKSYQLPPKKHLYYTNGLVLFIGALLVLSSWNIGNKPWDILGIITPRFDQTVIWSTFILIILYLADSYLSLRSLKDDSEEFQSMSHIVPVNWKEYRHFIFLAFAAGISEEIIYRGFLIPYLLHYLPSSDYAYWIAIVIPGLIFAVSHFYQGVQNVAKIFAISILFGIIFIQSGSLIIVMIIHVVIDLLSGILGVIAFNRLQKQNES